MKRRFGIARIIALAAFLGGGVSASRAAALFFDAAAPSNNATTRASWLAAAGVSSGAFFEDFEAIALDTNLHGVTGVLPGDLVINDTSTAHAAFVRGSSSYFGGTPPIGTRAVAHNEQAYLELDFAARPMDYVGGYDIDHTDTLVRVTFTDGATQDFSMESGTTAEFWGIYRNDRPQIRLVQFDATGDGEWGIDNLEFGPVPEPATLTAVGLGLAVLVRRWRPRR